MSEYLFVYRGGERATSPEDAQTVMGQWMTWLKQLGESGHLVDQGQPLEPEGKVAHAGNVITDGPYAEAKDLVGGFTLVKADSLAQAAELAKGCPILLRSGTVEVRPIMVM